MASLVVAGDSSGAVTLTAPAVAGTTTLTLPTSSGTLVVTGGAQTVQFAAGSAAAPSITFTGDTNTGIFSPAADTIAFTEGGVESMRIDSSGNVGIGTSSPAQRLVVGSSAAKVSIGIFPFSDTTKTHLVSADNDVLRLEAIAPTNSGIFAVNTGGSERMRIDSSGNVGIGTTTTSTYRATIANNGGNQLRLYATDVAVNTTNTIDFWYLDSGGTPYNNTSIRSLSTANAGNGNLVFYTRPTSGSLTERMRIDSGGNVGIGTNNPIRIFHVNAGAASCAYFVGWDNDFYAPTSAPGTGVIRIYSNVGGTQINTAYIQTNGQYIQVSDARLKKNIESARSDYLSDIQKLRVVKYNWINEEDDAPKSIGFVAQEVEKIFPRMVQTEENGQKMMKQSLLVPMLVSAIQEQQQSINDLKARIETLEGAK